MRKVDGEYKKKYILLEIDNEANKKILIDALKNHIEKLTKDIELYSKSEAYVRAEDIPRIGQEIALCMRWRDNINIMGSDTYISDFDFYKNGLERLY